MNSIVAAEPSAQGTPLSLSAKARSAVLWNAGFNLFRDLLQFGVMLVLVRLLKPEAYGYFGLVTSVVGFLSIFSFNQFVAHVLQLRDDREVDYQQHFTAGALFTLVLVTLTNIVAVALRWFPSYAPIAPLVHVMSLTFLFEWPCELRRKMLERDYDWRRLRLLHASGLLVSSVVAIIMGFAGAGAYSLLVPGLLVTLPFILDLFLWQHWRPNWSWSWAQYRASWHFGVARIGSASALSGRQLIEATTLAKFIGYTSFGIMNRAVGLATIFCSKFAIQLMYAIYPVLTRLNANVGNIARVNGLVLRFVAWMVIPLATILSVLAVPVVETIYGSNWHGVVPLLPWAMLGGITISIAHTANMLLLAQQQPRRCLLADIFVLLGTIAALALALPFGVEVYLIVVAMMYAAASVIMIVWLQRLQALKFQAIVSALLPPTIASAIAWFLCEAMRRLSEVDITRFALAMLYGLCFAICYLIVIRSLFARQLVEVIRYLPARKQLARLLLLEVSHPL